MRLEHYSWCPLTFNRDHVYDVTKPSGCYKPQGFWVSVAGEDDWPTWSLGEREWIAPFANRVMLADNANIHYIRGGLELEQFHDRYSVPEFPNDYPQNPRWREIDWSAVSQDFDGVIIAPYLWSHRLHSYVNWYYSWDCASGVIWNAKAIAAVEPLHRLALT